MKNRGWCKSDILYLGLLAGLCLLIGLCQIQKTPVINPDGVLYFDLAHRLPGDYVGAARTYPPGYPLILWAAHAAATLGGGPDSVMLWLYSAQAVTLLCRVLALIPLYFLGRLLVGAGPSAGGRSFWALLVLVFLPYPAQYAAEILREWPYVLFLSLGLWLLCWSLPQRRWWVLGLVGLAAGLGYLIRPECLQLVLYGLLGLASVSLVRKRGHSPFSFERDGLPAGQASGEKGECPLFGAKKRRVLPLCGAASLLVFGFLVPAVPNVWSTGLVLPHQLQPHTSNAPPVIQAVGPQAACDEPLEFDVAVGELLELPIQATDPDGDPLHFSLVGMPLGSRPVHQFWSMTMGTHFWTIRENVKNRMLSTYPAYVWGYEGIAFYAYPEPDARPGLHPVYRFWSSTYQRHFYTMDEREKEALLQESPAGTWQSEGIVFYAFAAADHPAPAGRSPAAPARSPGDTVPVYRSTDQENGYSWQVGPETGNRGSGTDTIVWYVHPAGPPPAGVVIAGGVGLAASNAEVRVGEPLPRAKNRTGGPVLRWRPRAGQEGQYQVNLIADDGELQSSQVVTIRVVAAPGKRGLGKGNLGIMEWWNNGYAERLKSQYSSIPVFQHSMRKGECPLFLQQAGLGGLLQGTDKVFDGIAEDLMVIFFVPWLLGLYWRLRYQAERTERVLVAAVVIVNLALVLGRHTVIGGPGDDRRYALALVVLTIFYVPVGIELLAGWLSRLCALRPARWAPWAARPSAWFYLLVAVGIVACLPKLLLASPGNKAGYRAAATWLQQNTPAEAVVAVPDVRICFYAQRQGLAYRFHPNARRVDYVVLISESGKMQVPRRWRQEYSVRVDRRSKKTLAIYSTGREGKVDF